MREYIYIDIARLISWATPAKKKVWFTKYTETFYSIFFLLQLVILVFAKMVHLMCTVLVAAPATTDTLELTAQRILMNVHQLNPC